MLPNKPRRPLHHRGRKVVSDPRLDEHLLDPLRAHLEALHDPARARPRHDAVGRAREHEDLLAEERVRRVVRGVGHSGGVGARDVRGEGGGEVGRARGQLVRLGALGDEREVVWAAWSVLGLLVLGPRVSC